MSAIRPDQLFVHFERRRVLCLLDTGVELLKFEAKLAHPIVPAKSEHRIKDAQVRLLIGGKAHPESWP